ncbi:MAG TPA: DUF3293 domain-containing protein [Gammaproteobacteria bacterium]|nr:DUF3293 domain-containing protein [Gammaproteobacteria bacterium]
MITAGLKQAWRDAIYSVKTNVGTTHFRIERAADNLEALPQCRSVTVITAWNPKGSTQPQAENDRAQAQLFDYVREQGYCFAPANGASPDGSHVEESLAVFDLDEAGACALGARFGQGAVMYWDGGEARLVWMPD